MKKMLWMVLLATVMVAGCGEGEEEKRFRAGLIEKALNDETRKAGNAFLAENGQRPGVVTTKSGLQYEVIKEGSGSKPNILDKVLVNYEGKRIDGFVFDSSYKRGKPSEFPVKGVVKGWREALLNMPVGSEWMLYIPADLAYGATSPNETIPANSTLIFKVELLEIKQQKPE